MVHYNIIVIGGGMAGICASVAAARLGSAVALVHDRPVLGGCASSENQIPISGANLGGRAWARYARETGIVEEFQLENLKRNPLNSPWVRDTLLWELVTREPNLSLHLNAQAREAVMDSPEKIKGITVIQTSTEQDYSLSADYFIDCSGDGRIAAGAGAAHRIGREARGELGETLAPETADSGTLPSAMLFRARRLDHPVPFQRPDWAYEYPTDDDLPFRTHHLLRDCGTASTVDAPYSFWWVSCGGDMSTINDTEQIRDTLLKVLMGVWDHVKNRGDHGAEYYALEWISPMAIRRESRRFEGDYRVRQQDILERTRFTDRIAYAGRAIDIHPPNGIFFDGPPLVFVELPAVWPVPFASLYSKNITNLLFAGRNISVSHVALGSTRVQSTCSILGQAAGTAAHLCRTHGITPRQLRETHISELQQLLLRQDCHIPHLRNEDLDDRARTAVLKVSSEAALVTSDRADSYVPLDRPRAQMFPVSGSRIGSISLLLRSPGKRRCEIPIVLHRAEEVNGFCSTDVAAESTGVVPGEGTHWVEFRFECRIEPHRLYWIELPETESLSWGLQVHAPLGCNRASGGEVDETVKPHWGDRAPRWFSEKGCHLFRLDPVSRPYGAANVVSGVNRPETWTNAWISDPSHQFPQWIELALAQTSTIGTVELVFDSELDASVRRWPPAGIFGCGAVKELVRDYEIEYTRNDTWKVLAHVEGNYQRRRVHRFEPVEADAVRVQVFATNGTKEARIYEIRIY